MRSANLDPPAEDNVAGAAMVSDEDLARRAAEGDVRAFEELVRRHQATVGRLLWRFGAADGGELEDLVQDTFVRAWQALPGWRLERPFVHWLRRIASNRGRDWCRRRRRSPVLPAGAQGDVEPGEPLDPAASVSAQLESGEAAAQVRDLLRQLPPDDRAVLVLHYFEGMNLAEIASTFHWTETTTKVRAFRARRRLRALLLEHGIEPS